MTAFQKDFQTGEIIFLAHQRHSSQFPCQDPYYNYTRQLQNETHSSDMSRLHQLAPVTRRLFRYYRWHQDPASTSPNIGAFPVGKAQTRHFCDFSKKLEKHWCVTLDSHLNPLVRVGRCNPWHLERTIYYHQFVAKGANVRSHFGQVWGKHDPDYAYHPDDDQDDADPPDLRSWAARDPISSRTRSRRSAHHLV